VTVAAVGAARRSPSLSRWSIAWVAVLAATIALYWLQDRLPWLAAYPSDAVVPVADWIGVVMGWVKADLSWLTRGIAAVIAVPLDVALGLLAKTLDIEIGDWSLTLPRLSWVGIVATAALAGLAAGGRSLGLIVGLCFLYIALFGQWESAMLTLALILICVPLCILVGLVVGVAAFRAPRFDRLVVTPALDLMQTVPTFAYLVPMLILFGNNPVSALLATAIYAIPPMVRATTLSLGRVPPELVDFADIAGCTRRQKLWRVLMPSARPTLMIGVNQVIMLSLNMVIISSMIGAGGLGYDVLLALRALKVGAALEAGLAIVALAIALDRLSQAAARQRPQGAAAGPLWVRHPYLLAALAALLVTTATDTLVPGFNKVPRELVITTAPMWKGLVDWITLHFFDAIEAFRTWLLLEILNPVKLFLLALPWAGALAMIALAGLQLGGVRLALLVAALTFFCAAVGLWEKTMTTVYLCGLSSVIAALIGIPLGIVAARSDAANRIITPVIDTLQTLPSFVFLIPVVMLFRVGDVTAMIAVVSFAVTPAIRYTNHGIRQVSPVLIEGAVASGCTPRQILWRVQLPLALPEIMLGINQTILLALSMLIIAAMVGTRDLGQEVFIALAKADPGRGIVAGLAVAFIGIVADRLIGAGSARTRRRLGLL
jgi:glycine betaine/proline transport system permease protein